MFAARLVRDWELRIQLMKSWNRWAWWSLGRVLVVVALQVVQRHRVVPFVVVPFFLMGPVHTGQLGRVLFTLFGVVPACITGWCWGGDVAWF